MRSQNSDHPDQRGVCLDCCTACPRSPRAGASSRDRPLRGTGIQSGPNPRAHRHQLPPPQRRLLGAPSWQGRGHRSRNARRHRQARRVSAARWRRVKETLERFGGASDFQQLPDPHGLAGWSFLGCGLVEPWSPASAAAGALAAAGDGTGPLLLAPISWSRSDNAARSPSPGAGPAARRQSRD